MVRRLAITASDALLFACLGWGLIWPHVVEAQKPAGSAIHPEPPPENKPPPAAAYAGDESCSACHKQEAQTYRETAHHLTSQWPSKSSIAGSFSPGANVLKTLDPSLTYVMRTDGGHYTESAVMQVDSGKDIVLTQPIDIVVGAGRKGQTYLFWKNDELFELPVSYWTQSKQWTYSPGYHDGSISFDKPIVPRCLECHGSYFESLAPPLNRFSKTGIVLGISCEKCHGPGAKHVALYSASKAPASGVSKAAKAIVNPASLSRERQMDVCSLCHAGAVLPLAPALTFLPGDDIARFLEIPTPGPKIQVDVHGNQVELLKRSRCYRSSTMTCSTCHNVHQEQRDAAAFSVHCLSCHKAEACGKFKTMGKAIANDCVDCHMPLQKSEVLFSELNGEELQPLVRNHQIAVYPETKAEARRTAAGPVPASR